MSIKLTIEYVREIFEKNGWKLFNTIYEGNQKDLDVQCPQGHITKITWNNFYNKNGCRDKCRICVNHVAYTYEYVKECFEKAGHILLSKDYIDNNTPLDYICVCGNISRIAFCYLIKGARCKNCRSKKLSEANRIKDEVLIEFCNLHKNKFVKSELKGSNTYITYFCKCQDGEKNLEPNHAYWFNFKRYPWCNRCGNANKSGSNCYMWKADRDLVEYGKKFRKKCGTLLKRALRAVGKDKTNSTESILGYHPIRLREHIQNHPNMKSIKGDYHIDHIFPIQAFLEYGIKDIKLINSLENLQPLSSADNISKSCKYDRKEFENWLGEHNVTMPSNDTLAQWLSELHVNFKTNGELIEVNNVCLKHVDLSKTGIKNENYYDYVVCLDKDIHLITVYSDEWIKRNLQCKNFIKSILGISTSRIYARECEIDEIDKKTASSFFAKHHIQGANRLSIVFFGLKCDGELVGAISLGRHSREQTTEVIVLDQLCFADGVQVVGGASKLFKRAIQWANDHNYKEIISFSDNRWSTGKVYTVLKFSLDREYAPDYSYVPFGKVNIRLSKQSQKKSACNCPLGLTEREWATQRGLGRIYDCGKKRWIFKLDNAFRLQEDSRLCRAARC